MRRPWTPLIWVVITSICSACLVFSSRETVSPDGQWRLHTSSQGEGDNAYHLSLRGKEVWSRQLSALPQVAVVTNAGEVAVLDRNGDLHILDKRAVETWRVHVPDPRVRWSSSLHIAMDQDHCLLETARGQIFELNRGDGKLRELEPRRAISGKIEPEMAIRLAIKNQLPLPNTLQSQHGPGVDRALAAYRALHGQPERVAELARDPQWRSVVEGAALPAPPEPSLNEIFREEDSNRPGGLVVAGVLHRDQAQLMRRASQGDGWAVRLLGQAGDERCLAVLREALTRDETFLEALTALEELQGEKAAPDILPYLRCEYKDRLAIEYFSEVRYPPAVPVMLTATSLTPELRTALSFQTGLDLGSDLDVWRKWWSLPESARKTSPLNPDSPLWVGIESQPLGKPRLLQQIALPGASRIGLRGKELMVTEGRTLRADYAWDLETGRPTRKIPVAIEDPVPSSRTPYLLSSRDGRTLVLVDAKAVRVFTPAGIREFSGEPYGWAKLSPTGRWLALSSQLVDLARFEVHPMHGSWFAEFDEQDRYRWGQPPEKLGPGPGLPPLESYSRNPVLSPDGSLWFNDGELWSLSHSKTTRLFAEEDKWARAVWSSDSQYLVARADESRQLFLYDRQGQLLEKWTDMDSVFAINPESTQIAMVGSDQTLHIWNIPEHRELFSIPASGQIEDLCYSSDGKRLAVLSQETARVWDLSGAHPPAGDPKVVSQLWTGRCLEQNSPRWLTPTEYSQLQKTWRLQTGKLWAQEYPAASPELPDNDGSSSDEYMGEHKSAIRSAKADQN